MIKGKPHFFKKRLSMYLIVDLYVKNQFPYTREVVKSHSPLKRILKPSTKNSPGNLANQ